MLTWAIKTRNVICALVGAGVLVFKHSYRGAGEEIVRAYAGNFSISFAMYFVVQISVIEHRYSRLIAAAASITAVTAFELTNGFGIMANVYDPTDILANAAGICFAVLVDVISADIMARTSRS